MRPTIASRQRVRGQSLVELLGGLIVLIPVLMLLVDLVVIFMAVQVNDTACRDAARAAANGRPIDYNGKSATSFGRAQAVVNQLNKAGGYIVGPTLLPLDDGVKTGPVNVQPPPSDFGGQYQGSYRVTTEITINLPASLPGLPSSIKLNSRQEFPITFTESNTSSPN